MSKEKSESVKTPTFVEVSSRTHSAHVAIDKDGNGVTVPPTGRVTVEITKLSKDFDRLESLGLVRIHK